MERIPIVIFSLLAEAYASEGIIFEDVSREVSDGPSVEYPLDNENSVVRGYRAVHWGKAFTYRNMLEFPAIEGCELALTNHKERWANDLGAGVSPSKAIFSTSLGGYGAMTLF